MCAASASAPIPLYNEGVQFWQDLMGECKRYVECANAILVRNGIDPGGLLECATAPDSSQISGARAASTKVKLSLDFRPWGPVIGAIICGGKRDGKASLQREFELPIARDLDSRIVAIYDEGRSFSPHEVASYLMQCFHGCYPGISLPC